MPTDPPSRERVQTVFKNVPFFSLYGLFWPQTAFFFSLRKRIWPEPNQSLRAFGRLLAQVRLNNVNEPHGDVLNQKFI